MSSRQEEKERRKQERLERERAEAAAAQRKRLAQIVGGVVVAAAVTVGVVIGTGALGGDKKSDTAEVPKNTLPIPAQKITDLQAAAKAANCVVTDPPIEGSDHVSTKVEYKSNPPTSGDHVPTGEQSPVGSYVGEGYTSPEPENYVHSLEHGRVIIQFRPGLAQRRISQLETLFVEDSDTDFGLKSVDGGYTLLMANNTAMPYEVAATAWGHMVACKTMNNKVFDALRAFRKKYILQGPEKVTDPE